MSEYCAILSPGFGLDPDVMRTASRLHDIGKIAVPDAILQKPGPLTAQERAQAERHAEMGHRLLAGSGSEVLEVAATIAWTHHERFDGTGYPRALAGEDIPLAGRVAAVADVFDALTSDRVYRRAFAVADAQEMLESERGGQFDPAVVDAFLAAMDEIRGIMARVVDDADVHATPGADAERLLTLQEAAMAVGVSASTMRRWADDGRIRAIRTAGGHRRFALDAVRQMAADRGPRAVVRPILPPVEPLPLLSRQLRDAGEDMAARAAASLYREGPRGWFAGPDGEMAIQAWLSDLVLACDTGRHTRALEAAETLMRRADVQGVSLLERHGFLERFGEVSVRVLSREQAPRPEILGARRLFVAMQQALLAGC
jgi:excisionase family DNA binding protein